MQATTKALVDLSSEAAAGMTPRAAQVTRELVLDVLGVAIAGSRTIEGRLIVETLDALGRRGAVPVPGPGGAFDVAAAALATGTMAYSIGLTDTHAQSITHPGPSVIATALTVGHATSATDDAILRSIVLGVEAIVRIGAVVNPSHRARGFHATASCNPFGTALTAGYLTGATREQQLWGMGIVGSMAGGLYEFRNEGAMLMALHGGLPAQSGVIAAALAQRGFTGPTTVLEGPEGFFVGFADEIRPEMLLLPDPRGWTGVENLSLRPYNACRYAHSAIDALGRMQGENGRFRPEDIASIVVWTHSTAVQQESEPNTLVSARLSTAFNVALALAHGPRLDEVTDEDLHDPVVRGLLERIQLAEDAELTAQFPAKWGSRVVVTLADGKVFEELVDTPKGEPENPFTGDDLVDKFRRLSTPVVGDEAVDRVIAAVLTPSGPRELSGILSILNHPAIQTRSTT